MQINSDRQFRKSAEQNEFVYGRLLDLWPVSWFTTGFMVYGLVRELQPVSWFTTGFMIYGRVRGLRPGSQPACGNQLLV